MTRTGVICMMLFFAGTGAFSDSTGEFANLSPVPFNQVEIRDQFWSRYLKIAEQGILPANIEFCEKTGRLTNFDKAAGKIPGKFEGTFFNDSDVHKMIEGACYLYARTKNPELGKWLDDMTNRIISAQQKDGYLNTYFTLAEPEKKWTNLRDMHEMYCAGHFIESAVAHFQATGKRNMLDAAQRLADHIDSIFGADKRHGVCGHEEIELALVRLYKATGEERYLKLADFFVNERGRSCGRELYGEYFQDHKPIAEQEEAVGHAVRAMYFYSAITDLIPYTKRPEYIASMDRLWENVATKKMYVTGSVGARHGSEAFGDNYELPNEAAYSETCAAVGHAFWNHRLALLYGDAKYADVMERVIYNGLLSGVSLDGKKFFYVNPLASRGAHHRSQWFDCACCPPNILRFIARIGEFVYAQGGDDIFINLYVAGRTRLKINDREIFLTQETRYPWDGNIKITVDSPGAVSFTLHARIPGWCRKWNAKLNGKEINNPTLEKGYLKISGKWEKGEHLEIFLDMPVERIQSHPNVVSNHGRIAIQRGPLVYCIETVDNPENVYFLALPRESDLKAEFIKDLLGGVMVIKGKAQILESEGNNEDLYSPVNSKIREVEMTAIPYYAWDNRAAGEMLVWIPEYLNLTQGSIIGAVYLRASHCHLNDTVFAVCDGIEPKNSSDVSVPRFTWWDHKGTNEWIQYEFKHPRKISTMEIYWFDDEAAGGGCRIPESFQIFYKQGEEWKPLPGLEKLIPKKDSSQKIKISPVETKGIRIEVGLRPGFSGGMIEWKVY